MSRLLGKGFVYIPSIHTDIRVSIEREQNRLKAIREEHAKNEREACQKIAGSIKPMKVSNG